MTGKGWKSIEYRKGFDAGYQEAMRQIAAIKTNNERLKSALPTRVLFGHSEI